MAGVVEGWANGKPQDEPALLNRITEALARNRRKCDVGVKTPMIMRAEFYELHRRGAKQADRYGSDIAVTIRIENGSPRRPTLLKTAFFQLKVSSGYAALLDSVQLQDSISLPVLKNRAFVLAVDERRFGYRVESVAKCLSSFGSEKTKTFLTTEWEFLSSWLSGWFGCERGETSDAEDPNGIEKLLEEFAVPHRRDVFESALAANLPPEILPSKY